MTTPLVPELPELPELSGRSPAAQEPERRYRPAATWALLLFFALTLVLPVLVRGVPVEPLVTVALLLVVAVAVLAVGTREDGAPSPAAAPAADESPCGLEDVSDTLRCDRPSGHSGAHFDGCRVQDFRDTLAAHIGEAGVYYRDRQGRPVPIDDAF